MLLEVPDSSVLSLEDPEYCVVYVFLCRLGPSWLGVHALLPAVRILLVAWDYWGVLQVLSCRNQGSCPFGVL